MTALALMMRPIDNGWAVYLTDGHELVRYRGCFSKQLALRYLQRYAQVASSLSNSTPSGSWRW
jgi:hypothetical protein